MKQDNLYVCSFEIKIVLTTEIISSTWYKIMVYGNMTGGKHNFQVRYNLVFCVMRCSSTFNGWSRILC